MSDAGDLTNLAAYRQLYVEHFQKRLATYGDDVRTLWNSAASQASRFAVLCQVTDLSGKTILDVGCGFGDLIGFLEAKRIGIAAYWGVDLSTEMIKIARTKYPRGHFECRDLLEQPFDPAAFDIVVGSGLFFLPHPRWATYVAAYVEAMFACCREAVAVNFLSAHSANQDPESYYASPSEVLGMLQRAVTPRVVLRHDYRANDFTVYLHK